MSVWGLGISSNETEPPPLATLGDSRDQIKTALAAFVKWIPAEVVAGYGAFVAANWLQQTNEGSTPIPSVSIFWVALAFCPILIIVAAIVASNTSKVARKIILSIVGFLIWSASVPHSVWERFDWFTNNHATSIGLILVLGGTAIAALGEWWMNQ